MKARIEKIGEEFGLMLTSEVVRACGFGSEANVDIRDKTLFVTAKAHIAREGWEEALSELPEEVLENARTELQAFRETADSWDSTDWDWPESNPNERV